MRVGQACPINQSEGGSVFCTRLTSDEVGEESCGKTADENEEVSEDQVEEEVVRDGLLGPQYDQSDHRVPYQPRHKHQDVDHGPEHGHGYGIAPVRLHHAHIPLCHKGLLVPRTRHSDGMRELETLSFLGY